MTNRLAVLGFLLPFTALAQTVRFQTNLGDIDVTLLTDSAPATVANFLKYVNRGSFSNSFFHRSVPGFVIQGGGFQFDTSPKEIPADPPVRNEFRVSNTRGTLAMAKLGNDPNSATTQWFFSLANNASILNFQNGGFTVFGRIANAAGLAVMDRIA
jgi:cyclophilin family peptidyl-prolyl cis-trans isomerase